MKKSQITAFVIVLLLLIVSFALLYLISEIIIEDATNPEQVFTPTLFPIERYVTYCIESELVQLSKQIALQGGTFDTLRESSFSGETRFIVHYTPQMGNYIISERSVAEELQTALVSRLDSCLDVQPYIDRGYSVYEEQKKVEIVIYPQKIQVILEYPLELERGSEKILLEKFEHTIESDLGSFIGYARDITNSELQGIFNADFFRIMYPDVTLIKDTPYPYTIFSLETKEDKESPTYLKFNFGIEEMDTSYAKFFDPSVLFPQKSKSYEGACYIEFNCYSYAQEFLCLDQNGTFAQAEQCSTENKALSTQTIISATGNDCTAYYDINSGKLISKTYKTGESWCTSEPGVGGRFYKLSCHDGTVYVEPCKDYRDEFCVEEVGEISRASCRINQFWSCDSCLSQTCCENPRRDCVWYKNTCVPAVTPGLQFWKQQEGLCTDDQCISSGDCGYQMNYYGNAVRLDPDYFSLQAAQQQRLKNLSIMGSQSLQEFIFPRKIKTTNFLDLFNIYLNRVDQLRAYTISNYLQTSGAEASNNVCTYWFSGNTQSCDACAIPYQLDDGTKNYGACTEYKCKTLGSHCQFEIQNGTPRCFYREPPQGQLSVTILTNESFTEETTVLGNGIRILEPLPLYKPIDILINTSQEALCKIAYLPAQFDEISSSDLSAFSYVQQHITTLMLTQSQEVIEEIPKIFEVQNFSEAIDVAIDTRFAIEAGAPDSLGIYSLIEPLTETYFSKPQFTQKLLEELDAETYYLFVHCKDRANQEAEIKYLSFSVEKMCDVNFTVLQSTIEDTSANIYLNKPGTCKYDERNVSYSQMEHEFDCAKNIYAPSSEGYLCTTQHALEELYISCRDLPELEYQPIQITSTAENSIPVKYSFEVATINISNQTSNISVFTDNRKYTEIVFDFPHQCTQFRCSSTRCILENFVGETICTPRTSGCTNQKEIYMTQFVEQTEPLLLSNQNFSNSTIIIEVSKDARCGIQMNPEEGYLAMNQQNNTHTFVVGDSRIGMRSADIICISDGKELRERISFIVE